MQSGQSTASSTGSLQPAQRITAALLTGTRTSSILLAPLLLSTTPPLSGCAAGTAVWGRISPVWFLKCERVLVVTAGILVVLVIHVALVEATTVAVDAVVSDDVVLGVEPVVASAAMVDVYAVVGIVHGAV